MATRSSDRSASREEVPAPGVSRFIAARLRAWGVDRVFVGRPGRDTDALAEALRGAGDHPELGCGCSR